VNVHHSYPTLIINTPGYQAKLLTSHNPVDVFVCVRERAHEWMCVRACVFSDKEFLVSEHTFNEDNGTPLI